MHCKNNAMRSPLDFAKQIEDTEMINILANKNLISKYQSKSNMRHFLLTIVIVLVIAMGLSSCLCQPRSVSFSHLVEKNR